MLQPVTKVVLIRKPKLQIERKSIIDQLEQVNPEPNVKKKRQQSKCQLFPLAVTSIMNHENIKGDNSSLLQHPNWLVPAVHLNNHPTLLNTHYRGSPDKARSNLVLQRNFNKSKNFHILKTKGTSTENVGESKKNNILKEILSDEEQINSAPKRKKLECFSNSPPLENKENLDNKNTLLLPHLPKNGNQNLQQVSSTENCLHKSFMKKINNKTESRLFQAELEEELKKVNGWEHIGNNQSVSNNTLPQIKNLPKNSVWNWFNGTAYYPRRRNLLLDWYTYDFCHPLSFSQSWPSEKEKNDIEIVGTQVGLQGSQRNSTDQSYIFMPVNNETQEGKMLKNFNGISIAQCFDESTPEVSSSYPFFPGHNLNGRFSQNPLPHESFMQERYSQIVLPKRISKLPRRERQTKQLSPFPTDTLWAKINLKEEEKQLSAWNHFTQQKPIQLPMSVLKQFKTKNSKRVLQNTQNMKIQPEFIENLAEKNLLYQS